MRTELFLSDWQINPWFTGWLCLVLAIYLRGFIPRMRRGSAAFRPWRALLFASGLFSFYSAANQVSDEVIANEKVQKITLFQAIPVQSS